MKRASVQERNKDQEELDRLYEQDETAWLERMAELIERERYSDIDYKNLREFLLDMARRDKREVMSRLTMLMTHLLKWQYQPRRRSRSWSGTIRAQRYELNDLLESGTLLRYAETILPTAYARARRQAAAETGLSESRFPQQCPFTLEELLAQD